MGRGEIRERGEMGKGEEMQEEDIGKMKERGLIRTTDQALASIDEKVQLKEMINNFLR